MTICISPLPVHITKCTFLGNKYLQPLRVYSCDGADWGRGELYTLLGRGQASFGPGLEKIWEPRTPLSTALLCEEGTRPICYLPHFLLWGHTWPASTPTPVPQASLLFLDLVCHNPYSSRLSFFWLSNCLPEPPAATNFSFLLAFSFSHRDRNVNFTVPIYQPESGHSFGVSN